MKNSGIAVCFNFEEEKLNAVRTVAQKCGIRVKAAEESAFEKPVGELFGFTGLTVEQGGGGEANTAPENGETITEFSEELMILCVFSGSDLNRFLRTLRENGIDVPYKAMLTETNKTWLASALARQIKAEHEQMHGA